MAKGGSRYQPEESNALMANGKKSGLPEKRTFAKFLFNKDAGTCLGRTAKSWVQIFVFYVIFYTLLALFWLFCLWLFLRTIDYDLPRYYGKGTIIGVNPGVGYQPWLKENPESTLIKFNSQDPQSYDVYVSALDKYFAKYENTTNTRICTGSQSNSDIIKDGKLDNSTSMQACRFELTALKKAGCFKENDYGFKTGQPCIVLSLNRLIGWQPENFNGGAPKEVARRYKPNSIPFNCDGTYEPDQEYIGKREYIPPEGIDGRFYPYAVMTNYHQPIAVVKFSSLPKNRLIQVQCRAYAKNIEQEIESGLGMVHFELLREDYPSKPKQELLGALVPVFRRIRLFCWMSFHKWENWPSHVPGIRNFFSVYLSFEQSFQAFQIKITTFSGWFDAYRRQNNPDQFCPKISTLNPRKKRNASHLFLFSSSCKPLAVVSISTTGQLRNIFLNLERNCSWQENIGQKTSLVCFVFQIFSVCLLS
uniref:Sodium/potassium-transporting ATPase subunit beta n=1 Tax=Panagrolaimus sp. JU765 TaxID=591449 RepID=A0AC34QS90_9BILA